MRSHIGRSGRGQIFLAHLYLFANLSCRCQEFLALRGGGMSGGGAESQLKACLLPPGRRATFIEFSGGGRGGRSKQGKAELARNGILRTMYV